jgi:hypothetical protein
MAEKKQVFTPAGGLNQDDSIVCPSRDTAGRSLFGLGDYRYALNSRIGSSRSDNFGDLETIKATQEVTNYLRKTQVFTNPYFEGSLSPWTQLDDGPGFTPWTWSGGYAIFTVTSLAAFTTKVLYQTPLTLIAGSTATIKIKYEVLFPPDGATFKIVFLNGASVISEETIKSGTIVSFEETVSLVIPATCDGIGIRMSGTNPNGILSFVGAVKFALATVWSTGTAPVGTEKTIGKLEDKEFLKKYYCNWNSNGDHTLRVYDYSTDTIYELMRWSGFGWSSTSFVKMAKLDNWLGMTDRENPPRLIDVDTIADLFTTLDTDFREFHISFCKWAPAAPPIPRVYYDNVTNNWEKLKNKTVQFSFRYVYNGNLKSTWSPISKAAVTPGSSGSFYASRTITAIEVEIRGSILDDPGASVEYNYFGHDDIKFLSAVQYIEVAFREGELDVWRLWKRVYQGNGTFAALHYFNGDYDGRPISDEDFNQPFDTVPFLAGTIEAIDNRFVFGDCLDELEQAEGVDVDDVDNVTDPIVDWSSSSPGQFPQFAATPRNKLLRLNALSRFNLKARGKYKAGIIFQHHTGFRSLVYTPDNFIFEIDPTSPYRLNALTFSIPESFVPPSWATSYQIVRTNVLNIDYFMVGMANKFYPLLDNPNQLIGLTNLPTNVKDRLNSSFQNTNLVNGYEVAASIEKAQKPKIHQAILKFLPKEQRDKLNKGFFDDTLNISGMPKSMADRLKRFPQVSSLLNELRETTQSVLANSARIYIDLNNWFNAAKSSPTVDRKISKLYYNFRQGDRVRFYGSTSASPSSSSQLQIYDVEILEFTGTGLIIEKPEGILSIPTEVSPYNVSGFDIEIYTPKISGVSDFLFYEVGEWYPILYPGTDDRDFAKRDWVYTNNAAITLSQYGPFDVFHKMPLFYGDCFNVNKPAIYRDFTPLQSSVPVSMSPDPNYTYGFWETNVGRPSIAYFDLPVSRFKPTMARFGGKILEESNVNAINRFRDSDQKVFPSEYGRIRDLVNTSNAQVESVGSILLAIGEREAWSIYVNRTTLEDLSGNTQVSVSDQVLGSYNTLLGSHGTLNPESISFERGRVYWWDAIDGTWVRYGRDGLTEISGYKMRNWFRELAALLSPAYATDVKPTVISGYDTYNDELVIFLDHSTLPSTFRDYANYKGAMFSEEDTRWKSIHNYTPELFGKVGTLLLSFRGGKLYKHEQGSSYTTFYDVKYDAYIEPIFNEEAVNIKSWQDIAITATDGWSVERVLSEYRGLRTKQSSRIPLASFDVKEDTYYAQFKNNLNSVNVNDPIVNGEKMRSKAIQVLLKLDPAVVTLSLLHYVTIGSIDSPKNPVNL